MNRLLGKVAVITGAAGGIGSATARLFAAEGARLVLVDVRAQALAQLARELGADTLAVTADVSGEADVAGYVKAAMERHGRIDVLFSNAGTEGKVAPIPDYPTDDFDRVIAVNLRGVYLSLKHTLPVMLAQGGGSIVLTSSIAGLKGFAGLSAYVASKHALVGLMRAAVLEAGPHGVRINTVHPGPIDTPMMRAVEEGAAPGAAAAARQQFESMIPRGRYGRPDDVARTVLFLASDDSAYCTGGRYGVDGGMSAG